MPKKVRKLKTRKIGKMTKRTAKMNAPKARARRGVKLWTRAEVARLKTAYKSTTATAIARELRRSPAAVKAKIRVLGLSKPATRKKAAPKRKAARRTTRRWTARAKPRR